ncbi:Homocysteine-responsive endoplasmic reticulum-resident ubiquitin-like domain member 2 protein [Schistosoma japonicum]|nr:Homocysteine-responsive endoplasmic reticulum-resident ubiquitin-like domain member 2 protein [Schistosoma japonicum]KAH8865635.1 Homocysteine-responsive endoplasmic reticulum-resident ubiquitin-like domain member 2 protein [Schistosoma japonicum]
MQKYQQAYYHYLQFFYMENPTVNQTEYHSQAYCWPYFFGTGSVMQLPPGNYPFSTQTPSSSHQATPSSLSTSTQQWIQRTQTFLSNWGVHFGNRRPQEVAEALPNDVGNNQRADRIQPQVAQEVMVFNNAIRNNIRQDDEANGVGNVDIIDRFYMLFRLCLFMGLCFAYSSLDKALIVFSVAAYVYLYNIYRRYAVVERVVQVQQGPQDEQGNSNQPSGEHSNSQQNQSIQEPIGSQINADLSNEQQPGLRRITTNLRLAVHTSYQFISALIASIIPEQPPPLHLD